MGEWRRVAVASGVALSFYLLPDSPRQWSRDTLGVTSSMRPSFLAILIIIITTARWSESCPPLCPSTFCFFL